MPPQKPNPIRTLIGLNIKFWKQFKLKDQSALTEFQPSSVKVIFEFEENENVKRTRNEMCSFCRRWSERL